MAWMVAFERFNCIALYYTPVILDQCSRLKSSWVSDEPLLGPGSGILILDPRFPECSINSLRKKGEQLCGHSIYYERQRMCSN